MPLTEHSGRKDGNALFLILIAVALFAALAYAVTRSGKGSGNVSKEQNILHAARIIAYAGSIENAVSRMMLINGCTDLQISFQHPSIPNQGRYANSASPSDNRCHLYEAAGGGIAYQASEAQWYDTAYAYTYSSYFFYTGDACINGVGTGTLPTCADSGADLLFTLLHLKKDICVQINNALGVTNPGGDPPAENFSVNMNSNEFGLVSYNGGNDADIIDGSELDGRLSACFRDTVGNPGGYSFYHVLIAR